MAEASGEAVGGKDWAERVVARYEAGRRVAPAALSMAMQVLGLKPGTVIRRNKSPRFDRLAVVAGAND